MSPSKKKSGSLSVERTLAIRAVPGGACRRQTFASGRWGFLVTSQCPTPSPESAHPQNFAGTKQSFEEPLKPEWSPPNLSRKFFPTSISIKNLWCEAPKKILWKWFAIDFPKARSVWTLTLLLVLLRRPT